MRTDRLVLKAYNTWTEGAYCANCGAPATDQHECWVNKGAVMCWPKERRQLINHFFNTVMLCNHCNIEITHEIEIKVRHGKLVHIGVESLIKQGLKPGDYTDTALMQIGVELVQAWIRSLDLKLPPNIRALASL